MISKDDIQALARLSRMEVSEAESLALSREIGSILEYVGQVKAITVETPKVELPSVRNVCRPDTPADSLPETRELLLQAFPERQDDYLKVKKIL